MGAYNSNAQDYDEKYLRFVKNVEFDMRGSLTGIKGYSDLLLTEDYGPLQESQREFIQRINPFVEWTYASLERHQKLATIESGILLVKKEPGDLASILNEIAKNLAELKSNNQIFRINVPNNLPTVKARFYEVHEIASGLIENSITNSLPGAQISVSTLPETNFVRTTISSSSIKPSIEDESEGRDLNLCNQKSSNNISSNLVVNLARKAKKAKAAPFGLHYQLQMNQPPKKCRDNAMGQILITANHLISHCLVH